MSNAVIINADARHIPLADESVQCAITSPPYFGLRDYGVNGQIGLGSLNEYIADMIHAFREVRRVLKPDGVLWLNLGDSWASPGKGGQWDQGRTRGKNGRVSYGQQSNREKKNLPGLKPKDLIGVPWRVAFAMQSDGWWLRSEIIWHKPNPMPESVEDRPTKAHEQIFLLTKAAHYFYNGDAIREKHSREWWKESVGSEYMTLKDGRNDGGKRKGTGSPLGRNRRSVWTIATRPYRGAHFATFPPQLVEPMVLAGSRPGDTILDPFAGTATVGVVALRHHRNFIGIELNRSYIDLAEQRLSHVQPTLIGI